MKIQHKTFVSISLICWKCCLCHCNVYNQVLLNFLASNSWPSLWVTEVFVATHNWVMTRTLYSWCVALPVLADWSSGCWTEYGLVLMCHQLMSCALDTGSVEVANYNYTYMLVRWLRLVLRSFLSSLVLHWVKFNSSMTVYPVLSHARYCLLYVDFLLLFKSFFNDF